MFRWFPLMCLVASTRRWLHRDSIILLIAYLKPFQPCRSVYLLVFAEWRSAQKYTRAGTVWKRIVWKRLEMQNRVELIWNRCRHHKLYSLGTHWCVRKYMLSAGIFRNLCASFNKYLMQVVNAVWTIASSISHAAYCVHWRAGPPDDY